MTLIKAAFLSTALSISSIAIASVAIAQTPAATVSAETVTSSGSLIKKRKKLKGDFEIVERDGASFIRFDENFRAAGGPDLKVFLSPKDVASVTGKTAVDGSVNLGELTATKGAQEYKIPAGLDLSDFKSVLVHCEAYSVLWGGGDL